MFSKVCRLAETFSIFYFLFTVIVWLSTENRISALSSKKRSKVSISPYRLKEPENCSCFNKGLSKTILTLYHLSISWTIDSKVLFSKQKR